MFNVSMLTIPFLNPDTRKGVVKNYYLLQMKMQ